MSPPGSHEPTHLLCFPNQLNQVFMNLIRNARQAMPEGGTPTIRSRVEGTEAIFEVVDDGVGIPAEDLPKVFDPGFTKKGVRVGTGLGSSICYQVMDKHGGHIALDSEEGAGTTATVRLSVR